MRPARRSASTSPPCAAVVGGVASPTRSCVQPRCGGTRPVPVVACITQAAVIDQILAHLRARPATTAHAGARSPPSTRAPANRSASRAPRRPSRGAGEVGDRAVCSTDSQPAPIEIPSVKRRPASSPEGVFLRLPGHVLRSSERSSRCGSAFCSRSWMGRDGPGAVGWYERADGANDPTTSIVRGASRNFPRSPLPIQSSRFAPGVRRYAARGWAAGGRGRIRCASYATSSRHIA